LRASLADGLKAQEVATAQLRSSLAESLAAGLKSQEIATAELQRQLTASISEVHARIGDLGENPEGGPGSVADHLGSVRSSISEIGQKLDSSTSRLRKKVTANTAAIATIQKESADIREYCSQQVATVRDVFAQDQEETRSRLVRHDDAFASLEGELQRVPRIINEAVDERLIGIGELQSRVEGELQDMRSQLQQAAFADEEIAELRSRLEQTERTSSDGFAGIEGTIAAIQRDLQKRREAEAEIVRIAGIVEDLKLNQDVMRAHADGGSQGDPEVEIIRLKVVALEEGARDARIKTAALSEAIENLSAVSANIGLRIRDDVERLGNALSDRLVDADTFAALRAEVDLFREATTTSLQAAIEEREATRDQIEEFRRLLTEISARAAGGPAPEVIGGRLDSKGSADDVRKLEQKIQGIDSKIQRDIRKLKGRLRSLERALEDAAQETKQLPVQPVVVERVIAEPGPEGAEKAVEQLVVASPIVESRTTEAVERITSQVRIIQDDFQLFFVVMFSLLVYFLVADLFSS
jgi:hypothetical protein